MKVRENVRPRRRTHRNEKGGPCAADTCLLLPDHLLRCLVPLLPTYSGTSGFSPITGGGLPLAWQQAQRAGGSSLPCGWDVLHCRAGGGSRHRARRRPGVLGRAGASDPLAALHQPREAAAVASAVGLYMLAIRVDRAGAALRMSRAVHGRRLDRAVHTLHGHLGAGIVHAAWVACQSSSMLGGMQV